MTETIITVQGAFSSRHAPERAVARLAASLDGPGPQAVHAAVTEAAAQLGNQLDALRTSGAVASWSSNSLASWADRPWNNEGAQLPLVHHATIDITAVFEDFAALSTFLTSAADTPAVHLGGVAWELREESQRELLVEARQRAVTDAVSKATGYARSVGLTTVRAIALADPGMLDSPTGGSPRPAADMASARMMSSGGPPVELRPEEIVLEARVDARFRAS